MEDKNLFKAKLLNNEEWVQGALVYDSKDELYRIITGIDYSTGTCVTTDNAPRVNTSTICQCTGLKDKNGKLIWENDIVVCHDFTEEKYVIAWKQDEACFEYQQYGCSIMNFEQLSGCEVEVIGNILDNAGLLESEG